jgi:hypothetical protein
MNPEEKKEGLDEALKISEEKGIASALNQIEKDSNWKLEDDFHDELSQEAKQGKELKSLKTDGSLYRAVGMTLFEIVIPEGVKNTDTQPLASVISSMESFYAGMMSVSEEKTRGKSYMVLEIANGEGSEEFVFYASVPTEKAVLFEKQLISIFPQAKLVKREHDYNIFNTSSFSVGSMAELGSLSAFPLKTYESFDHDPLNSILNGFSKIPKDGAGAALQIVFSPKGDTYTKKFTNALKKIEKGEKAKDVLEERGIFGEIAHTLFKGEKKKKEGEAPNAVDTTSIALIQKKLESPAVETNMRLAVSAPSEAEAMQILSELESGFNQFEIPGSNKIIWKRVKGGAVKKFFRDFTFRLFSDNVLVLNLRELTSVFHFHTQALSGRSELRQAKAGSVPAPLDLPHEGVLLGINDNQGRETKAYFTPEDRLRHFYVIGQTGTGKTSLLKNMILDDIRNGDGVCFIDPHGSDVEDVLSLIPEHRRKDVIYFDPAYVERPMALNMLEYDRRFPEQKTFVVNEMLGIFNKLFDMKTAGGPMFEQYFRNAVLLTIDDPETGTTLIDVSRVLSDKSFRDTKLAKCTNPLVVQFWTEVAGKAGGEASLQNMVPYIVSKFDNFLSNDIMRPVIAQEHSSWNFREIMDGKKILLVNLSKGRLGDLNANLIGLVLVGKILMAALSRVDSLGQNLPSFYLYIDEFQNITTDSISAILSEARKYKLSLTVAHQFIAQLDEKIRDAVFGNVGSMAIFRVGAEDAEVLEKQLAPTVTAKDLQNIDNYNAYLKLLVKGIPQKPFNIRVPAPERGEAGTASSIKAASYEHYGRPRAEIEAEIMAKYRKSETPKTAETLV